MKRQCGGLLKKIKTGMVCRRCYLFYPKPRTKEEIEMLAKDVLSLHKPDKDCDTIERMEVEGIGGKVGFDKKGDFYYTTLDAVAIEGCKSTTPNLKRKP